MVLFQQPGFLLWNSKVAIVEYDSIFCLTKGTDGTRRVDAISLYDVGKNLVVAALLTLCRQFIITTLGTHIGACSNKDLEFRIREYNCSYVAAIHDDAFGLTHQSLEVNHCLADKA